MTETPEQVKRRHVPSEVSLRLVANRRPVPGELVRCSSDAMLAPLGVTGQRVTNPSASWNSSGLSSQRGWGQGQSPAGGSLKGVLVPGMLRVVLELVVCQPEKRKVGSSTLPLTTSFGLVSSVLTSANADWALSCSQPSSDHDCPCVTVVGRSLSHADRMPCLRAPGSRPLRLDPNLQIRRFLYRRPALFRTVHDLGLVSYGCPGGSGAPEGCSSAWLPADDSVTPWSSSPSPGLFLATRPRPVLSQAPPPNPIAAEPDGRRVLSRGGVADHE